MISDKFVGKYMRQAKLVGEDRNPCYSRKIGIVIVRTYGDGDSKILGTGYNGPPRKTPHCTDPDYLKEVFWPQLTVTEKTAAASAAGCTIQGGHSDESLCNIVCEKFGNEKICPRKIVGAASGQRLELCSCAHGETNAIVNCSEDLHGAIMFCWCGVPCFECTKLIINAGIKTIYVVKWANDYSRGSRWLFAKKGVEIIEHPEEYYLNLGE